MSSYNRAKHMICLLYLINVRMKKAFIGKLIIPESNEHLLQQHLQLQGKSLENVDHAIAFSLETNKITTI